MLHTHFPGAGDFSEGNGAITKYNNMSSLKEKIGGLDKRRRTMMR